MAWRLLLDPPAGGDAAGNMAVDEALLVEAPRSGATLRLYTWAAPSVSVGYRQNELPWLERARELRIPCVRRVTGGGAVLHGHDLTYAVVAPRAFPGMPDDMRGSYLWIRDRLLEGLRAAGVAAVPSLPVRRAARAPVCFEATTGVEIDRAGAKLVGSAQRRTRSAFLEHGSIRCGQDAGLERALFGASAPSCGGGALDLQRLRNSIVDAFSTVVDLRPGVLGPRERAEADGRSAARRANPLARLGVSLRPAPAFADTHP